MPIKKDVSVIKLALDGRPEVENLIHISSYVENLEIMFDNAHNALQAVLASGEVQQECVIEMLKRGLNNEPQLPSTRLS